MLCSEKSTMCCRACLLPVTNELIPCGCFQFPALSLPPHSILTVEAHDGRGAKEGSDSLTIQGHDDGAAVAWPAPAGHSGRSWVHDLFKQGADCKNRKKWWVLGENAIKYKREINQDLHKFRDPNTKWFVNFFYFIWILFISFSRFASSMEKNRTFFYFPKVDQRLKVADS